MSLRCPVGPESNLLTKDSKHASRMVIDHPIVTLEQIQALKDTTYRGWRAEVIDCTIPVGGTAEDLQEGLTRICEAASEAVQGGLGEDGAQLIILSDKMTGPDSINIPSLLAVGAGISTSSRQSSELRVLSYLNAATPVKFTILPLWLASEQMAFVRT